MKTTKIIALILALTVTFTNKAAEACSRATWCGSNGDVVTGRSMDWPYDFNTHFYIIPREELNVGIKGGYSWKSKYGAVVLAGALNATGPINGVFDGLNERGLGVNMLYLAETNFTPAPADSARKISWAAWLQYIVSNFATVNEAVTEIEKNPVYLVPVNFGPGGAAHPSVHLSLTDASGDSAIMEYLDGKLVVHHSREHQVMTNSPTYDKQLALNTYWSRMDGSKMLPGSHQSEDRFVRASYYLKRLGTDITDQRRQIAGVLSVMRNISVPWGAADPLHPNIAPTYWRSVLDHTRKQYYFESALSPYIVMVDLNKLDLSPGSGIRSVALEGPQGFALVGEINGAFKAAKQIEYLAP
jgi:penicillin V acylase-like amidase (Ntn superfamily)